MQAVELLLQPFLGRFPGAIRREQGPVVLFRDPAALLDALHQKAGSPDQKNLMGSLSMAVITAYLVGVFGPAFIEVVLARLRSGKGGTPDA